MNICQHLSCHDKRTVGVVATNHPTDEPLRSEALRKTLKMLYHVCLIFGQKENHGTDQCQSCAMSTFHCRVMLGVGIETNNGYLLR